jgi:Tetratricopeptide repeat
MPMSVRSKILSALLGISVYLIGTPLKGQLLRDTVTLNQIRKEIDYTYNFQFDSARQVYEGIRARYPEHPIIYLMNGMLTFWENYPMLGTTPARTSFEKDMRECISLSEKSTNAENQAEYLLSDLCARGMLLLYYSNNDLMMDVIPLTTGTYKYLMRSFDFTSVFSDFYYFTGLYNYYRDAYPRIYPVYKPLAMLFPRGNMETGLKQLKIAAKSSVVLRAESNSLLAYIYLNYEKKYPEALYYAKLLYEQYPDNLEFLAMYIKNLLLMKRYDDAEKVISNLPADAGNKYFQSQLMIFRGILTEKKYHNMELARQDYNRGITDLTFFGEYGNDYAAYAYFGLSRISEAAGDKHAGRIYRREALRRADFKKIDFD